MRPNVTWLAASLLALATCAVTGAARAIEVPQLMGPVNDYANMLSAPDRQQLADRLRTYRDQTGSEFTLLTVPALDGQPIEDFGIKVAEKWKLGGEKSDQGLILIIALQDRRARIEVGYGLEGNITDAFSARVIREVLAPALGAGQYSRGINAAMDSLMRAASGDVAQAEPRPKRRETVGKLSPIILPLILFVIFGFLGGGGRRRRRGIWGGPFIGLGGGGWGGGGFGGGGGGSWGGGGGGFGGGGASGNW